MEIGLFIGLVLAIAIGVYLGTHPKIIAGGLFILLGLVAIGVLIYLYLTNLDFKTFVIFISFLLISYNIIKNWKTYHQSFAISPSGKKMLILLIIIFFGLPLLVVVTHLLGN